MSLKGCQHMATVVLAVESLRLVFKKVLGYPIQGLCV